MDLELYKVLTPESAVAEEVSQLNDGKKINVFIQVKYFVLIRSLKVLNCRLC